MTPPSSSADVLDDDDSKKRAPAGVVQEAQRLVALYAGNEVQLIVFLSGQLSVLKNQSQILMGLCGLVITVTGFSGHHMVRGGMASTLSMITGIVLVLGGVLITFVSLGKLRWVSQDLSPDLVATATRVIQRRNDEQVKLRWAMILVGSGLAGYLLAVVLAALHNGQLTA